MQVLAVGNAAITPGGTTAATGSPVTSSGLSSPGLAAEWRLPGLAGLVGLTGSVRAGGSRAASAVPAAVKGGTVPGAGSLPADASPSGTRARRGASSGQARF